MVAQKKQIQVQQLSEILKQSSNFILIGFENTPHQTLENLRKKLAPFNTKLKVIKNTLLEKSLNKMANNHSLLREFKKKLLPLKYPSALLIFKNNWDKGLKIFYDFIQKEKTLIFKLGLIDGQIYNSPQLLSLAQLPSKNQLLTNIVNSIKNPIHRLIFITQYNSNKLVYILKKISEKK